MASWLGAAGHYLSSVLISILAHYALVVDLRLPPCVLFGPSQQSPWPSRATSMVGNTHGGGKFSVVCVANPGAVPPWAMGLAVQAHPLPLDKLLRADWHSACRCSWPCCALLLKLSPEFVVKPDASDGFPCLLTLNGFAFSQSV